MIKILILIIKFYKYFISPLLGNKCRFLPTCSEYFIEALKTQGFITGTILSLKRISKCHPFKKLGGSHGIDFVPVPKKINRQGRLKKIADSFQRTTWTSKDKKVSRNG